MFTLVEVKRSIDEIVFANSFKNKKSKITPQISPVKLAPTTIAPAQIKPD